MLFDVVVYHALYSIVYTVKLFFKFLLRIMEYVLQENTISVILLYNIRFNSVLCVSL